MHMVLKRKMPILLLTSLLVFALFSACNKTEEKTVTVDFTDRTKTGQTDPLSGVRPLRIAVAPVISPKETAQYYNDMMTYIGNKMGTPVEIEQRKTYREINNMIESRELDLAFLCAGPYVEGKKKFGMELLVAPMLYGKALYQAYFIVHKNSGIESLEQLRGKSFAFTDPDSNTGRLVPTYLLAEMGEKPETFFKDVIFTYSHDNSIKAVAKRLVDGASVDGLIWDYFQDTNPEFVQTTRVIHKSPFYGIPPVVVHPGLPSDIKSSLRNLFLNMHLAPEGKEILEKIKVEKFIVPDDSSYDSIREMKRRLEQPS